MTGRIVLLEGADGSGKSFLAADLKARYGARVMHGRVWRQMEKWHAGMMRRAMYLKEAGELVVLDRHWVSEFVYGPIFRNGTAYGDGLAELWDRFIREAGGVVLCSPRDRERHLRLFEHLKTTRPEKFVSMDLVVRRYVELRDGYMYEEGTDYLSRYVQHGDFLTKPGGFHYDLFEWWHNAEEFNDQLMERIKWKARR